MSRQDADLQTARPRRQRQRQARWTITAGILLVGAIATVGIFRVPLFQGNFGVVDPGKVYRSAQPMTTLPPLPGGFKAASILNLRGGSAGDSWYEAEVNASRASGADFYDFPMSATRRPRRRELLTLLDLFERCRYPLLIHCKSGSDRTGLASALYLMDRKGVPPREALAAFTLYHGHVPLLGPERLHEPINAYADWLDARQLEHTSDRFHSWILHEYRDDGPGESPFSPIQPGPRARLAEARKSVR